MIRDGLLKEPELENLNKYLKSGTRTEITDIIRSAGIPTMQILTLSKNWGKEIDKGKKIGTYGHFFAGVYLQDIYGKFSWVLVDPDRYVKDTRDVRFRHLKTENRNMRDLYTFAYVSDYFDDLHIDSIRKMSEVQLDAYQKCNKRDFEDEHEISDR